MAGKKLEWKLENIVENTLPHGSNLLLSNKKRVLEEYAFEVNTKNETMKIAEDFANAIFPSDGIFKFWKDKIKKDMVILSDDEFTEFVTTSTEVITRTRISSKTGTVERGGLWTEEYLPQDTILYSIAMAFPIRVSDDNKKGIFKSDLTDNEAKKVIEFFKQGLPEVIQIGGNQTLGKGIVRI